MAIDKITTPGVTDDSVTLAKMAPGTDGNIISYDASGNPVAVATGSDGQVLTSTGAGSPPAFETPASAANTPAFLVKLSADVNNQTGDSSVKVPYNTEIYDTDNAYDNSSNYRFTVPSGKGGKYYIFIHQHLRDQDANANNSRIAARIYKNGSFFTEHQLAAPNGTNIFAGNLSNYASFGINMDLSAGNYIEFYCVVYSNNFRFQEEGSFAGGFKLI